MDVDAQFQAGLDFHRRGRLAEAEALYRTVLEEQPTHFEALDLLGVICVNSGRYEPAVEFLSRAATLKPRLGRTHAYLGFALRRLGRAREAVAALDRAAVLGHRDAESLNSRGVAFLDLRRFEDAAADFEAALELSPDMALAAMNLGIALSNLDREEDALASFDRVVAIDPTSFEGWFRRGGALKVLRRFQNALESFDRAMALDPRHAPARYHRAAVLTELGRYAEALESADAALSLSPGWIEAQFIRARILALLGRHAEAVEAFTQVVATDPQHADAYRNRALSLLALGRFEEGWRDNEQRWRVPNFIRSSTSLYPAGLRDRVDLTVQRSELTGRDVLVVAEQGVGDVIMFASILPDLMADAGRVAMLVERRLHRLFANAFPDLRLITSNREAVASQGIVLPLASLGRLYRNALGDFPGTPYLAARPNVRARWAERLGPRRGLRVGLSWRGGTPQTRKAERSMALDDLRPLLDLPGCEFVNLQYGDVAEEVARENARRATPIWSPPAADVEDFEELAGLVQSLDLVVSVQTAIVHLGGALGVSTFAMAPSNPEWRYAGDGPTIPWYGAVRMFRQDDQEGWGPVIREVVEAVRLRMGDV